MVIGGGLTAIDTATELMAYYPVQIRKLKRLVDQLSLPQVMADLAVHPVRRVGAEARAAIYPVLVDGRQQPDVALAHQVLHRLAAAVPWAGIAAGDALHQRRHARDDLLAQSGEW